MPGTASTLPGSLPPARLGNLFMQPNLEVLLYRSLHPRDEDEMKKVLASFALRMAPLCLGLATWLPMPSDIVFAAKDAPTAMRQIEERVTQGRRASRAGNFERAARCWRRAGDLYDKLGHRRQQINALIWAAEAYQTLGQYAQALQTLSTARAAAAKVGDQRLIAAVTGSLGKAYLSLGEPQAAAEQLETSVALARQTRNLRVAIASLNNLGKLLSDQGRIQAARARYLESARLSKQASVRFSGLKLEHARALAGLAKLALRGRDYGRASVLLTQALIEVRQLRSSHDQAFGLIALGRLFQNLRAQASAPVHAPDEHGWMSSAYQAFAQAAAIGERLGDIRAVAYARGHLGQLYAQEQRLPEALQLTRQAIFAAQQAYAPEILYRWQWQSARLLKAQGDLRAAVQAYSRAVYSLQAVRQDLATAQTQAQYSFHKTTGPLFFELADLLLKRASAADDS